MDKPDSTFLDNDEGSYPSNIYDKLLLKEDDVASSASDNNPISRAVVPSAGFCVKTCEETSGKVFINICHNDQLPCPAPISDEEVVKQIGSEQPTFRVQMSIGLPHTEQDNTGASCTAYDVIVHPDFLHECRRRDVLLGFFLSIVLEGLEHKYELRLSREWKILKNRKFLGKIPEQHVRTSARPLIEDMGSVAETPAPEVKPPRGDTPPYTIIQEPPTGHPEYLVMEIQLPRVRVSASVRLDVGEDRVVLTTRADVYHLDIFLPYNVVREETGAQFNRANKTLTLTMPVQPLPS